MNFSTLIVDSLIYLIPCFVINASLNVFGLAKKEYPALQKIDRQFDMGLKFFDHRELFGASTTWGGLVLALVLGLVFNLIHFGEGYGILIACTTFFGHALGSFIKRRFNMPRGAYLPIVDHGDYMILTGIVFWTYGLESLSVLLLGLILVLIFQPPTAYLAYRLGWRDNKI